MEELLNRLKKYRYDTDDTYKNVAIVCQIPFSTFYNLTNGTRNLKDKYAVSLDTFLKEKGY